jgi:PilZ domain
MMGETDRRSKFRKRPLSLVYVELATGNGGMMRDLCEEGLALRAMMPLRPGEITAFSFSLDPGVRVEGEGRMIWVEEGGRVAGLEFTRLSPESLKHIQQWLQRAEEGPREEEVPVAPAQRNSTLDELRQEARSVAARPPAPRQEPPKTPRPEVPRNPTPRPDPLRAGSRDVTVFPAPPREIRSQEELKKEIHEALRQAAEERLAKAEEERPKKTVEETPPPVQAAAPPPPPPPPVEPPPAPPAAAATPPPPSHSPVMPLWNTAHMESLPAIDDMDFGRHPGGRSAASRLLLVALLAALGFGAYMYRRQVGQAMIQAGQRISESNQSPVAPSTTRTPAAASSTEDATRSAQNSSESANRSAAESSNVPASSAAAPPASVGSEAIPPSSTGPASGPAPGGQSVPPSYVSSAKPNPASVIPVSPLVSGAKPTSNFDSGSEAGQAEYAQALQMLRASKDRANLAESARLLWIAVEKGNSNAEVALAELYRLGQGVSHNCDQARVLLTAAARKGNPEGVKHLQLFEQAGCE